MPAEDGDPPYGETVTELVEFAAKATSPDTRASLLMLADLFKKLGTTRERDSLGLPSSDRLQH
jgi:hypothetical protein